MTIDYVEISPDKQIGLHSQPSWELSYVVVGRGNRLIGNTTSLFIEGDLVLIPPNIQHCWYFLPNITDSNGNIVNICISFSSDFLTQLKELFPQLAETVGNIEKITDAVSFTGNTAECIANKINNIAELPEDLRVSAYIDLLVSIGQHITDTKIVGSLVNQDITRDRISQIKNFVDCNYARRIGVQDIAEHLGMSRSSFSSFFRKNYKITFIEYLNNYRLTQAHYLLRHNNLHQSVSGICYTVGFQSISHFNHIFKNRYGYTPKQVITSRLPKQEP